MNLQVMNLNPAGAFISFSVLSKKFYNFFESLEESGVGSDIWSLCFADESIMSSYHLRGYE